MAYLCGTAAPGGRTDAAWSTQRATVESQFLVRKRLAW
jgi:hypothetical protein